MTAGTRTPGPAGKGICPTCKRDGATFSVGKTRRLSATCGLCLAQTFARGPESDRILGLGLPATSSTPPASAPAPAPAPAPTPAKPEPVPAPAAAPGEQPRGGWGFFR